MMLGASGTASAVETVQLFTTEEAMTAMTKAARTDELHAANRRLILGCVSGSEGQDTCLGLHCGSRRQMHAELPQRSIVPPVSVVSLWGIGAS